MKIIYKPNIDCKCAAALVYRTMSNVFMMPTKDDFYECSYKDHFEIDKPSITSGECVYILGLELNGTLFTNILSFINEGCKVVHIDNHGTTLEYLNHLSTENRKVLNGNVKQFYRAEDSISAITWAVSCMNEEERTIGVDTPYDFSESHTHCMVGDDNNSREYVIPMAIRYINDTCMDVHEIGASDHFMYALMGIDDNPMSDDWPRIIDGSTFYILEMVDHGVRFENFYNHINERITESNGFVLQTPNLFGVECLCVNTPHEGVEIFGDSFDKYPMCCRFFYNGKTNEWVYVLYASDNYEGDKVDILSKAKSLNGGKYDGNVMFFSSFNILEK